MVRAAAVLLVCLRGLCRADLVVQRHVVSFAVGVNFVLVQLPDVLTRLFKRFQVI
jgi:hypothetical protein